MEGRPAILYPNSVIVKGRSVEIRGLQQTPNQSEEQRREIQNWHLALWLVRTPFLLCIH